MSYSVLLSRQVIGTTIGIQMCSTKAMLIGTHELEITNYMSQLIMIYYKK